MPDVRNCRRCGKIFNYLGGVPICQDCKKNDEEEFKRIKEYLYENPGASISQVSIALDVSIEKIKRYLKEGRLEIVGEDSNMVLECEVCGKAIKTGRYCEMCERELASAFKNTAGQMNLSLREIEERKQHGLRYLNKDDLNREKK